MQRKPRRKVTVALPHELPQFADDAARQADIGRSRAIGHCLAAIARNDRRLTAEGYHFYAEESVEFAAISARAVAEAISTGVAGEGYG